MEILSDLKLKKIPAQPKGKINNGAQQLNLRLIILLVNLKIIIKKLNAITYCFKIDFQKIYAKHFYSVKRTKTWFFSFTLAINLFECTALNL